MPEQQNFQVNLRGVIDLLSDHLYSGPQVYIRELLQNAIDAIVARQKIEPQHVGSIRLELIAANQQRPATMIVHDNGIGLTEDEVHEFLATIGQSSKREDLDRQDFIGQFGIGLLSGFMVSEELVVITRSVRTGSRTVQWKGESDGTYTVKVLDQDFEPGTQVFLRCKAGSHDYFEPAFVRDMVHYFGVHLPVSIQVEIGNQQEVINEPPVWLYDVEDDKDMLLEYGLRHFETKFLDVIPLNSAIGDVQGVAFVLPYAAKLTAKSAHRVYLKSMLLSEKVDNLLPDWAFFVKCVVNARDLRPTAARDSFYADENLNAARETLSNCLRRYLIKLAADDVDRLRHIIELHYLPIKSLAVDDDDFYRVFIDWLPFETTMGQMTLAELKRLHKPDGEPIRFVATRDQFRQISSVAAAQSLCIINAGYTYDQELLQKLPDIFPDDNVEQVDVSQLAEDFDELSLNEREEVFELIKLADLVLQPFRCAVEIRKFQPAQLPTLYTANDQASFMRSIEQSKDVADDLWSGVLDRIAADSADTTYSQLCLNYNNQLIRQLTTIKQRDLLKRSIEMLYVQALLLGHYPLGSQEMNILNSGLQGLIEMAVSNKQDENRH